MAEDRVQKILARAGYGSRRASEDLITAGRVRINGQTAVLGSKADPEHDTITVDNQSIAREQAPLYVAVNKPTGVLSEVSPDEPRDTVRDLVPLPGHLFIVGRLDMDSEGLILLTNDGELANKLTHPRYGHEKEYRVLMGSRPDEKQVEAWQHGIILEDGYRTAPAQIHVEALAGKGAWVRIILREGRKRQIREMGKLTGLPVLRIQRIRIGTLLLGDLKPGQWRQLRSEEVRALQTSKPRLETVRPRPGSNRLRPTGDRDRFRPHMDRPRGERTPSDPARGEPAYNDRPGSDRPSSSDRFRPRRPGTARPGERPNREGSYGERDRAARGQPGEERPRTGQRPPINRAQNETSEERTGTRAPERDGQRPAARPARRPAPRVGSTGGRPASSAGRGGSSGGRTSSRGGRPGSTGGRAGRPAGGSPAGGRSSGRAGSKPGTRPARRGPRKDS